jgi:hypothetical protein
MKMTAHEEEREKNRTGWARKKNKEEIRRAKLGKPKKRK